MPADETGPGSDLVSLAGGVVAAYATNNSVPKADIASRIGSVHAAFAGLATPASDEAEKPVPKIPIRKSITPEFLISFEDGRK